MMVTLGIYVRRWQRMLRRFAQDPRFHSVFQAVGYLSGGFLLSAASLGSCPMPFTLGLLMSQAGWPAVLLATATNVVGSYIGAGLAMKKGATVIRPMFLFVLALLFVRLMTTMLG